MSLPIALPVKAADHRQIGQLHGAARSLVLAHILKQHQAPVLVLTNQIMDIESLKAETAFFAGKEHHSAQFVDWETLPYDLFSPHQDIISNRLTLLNELQQGFEGVVFASTATASHRLCPPSFIAGYSLNLKVGQKLDIATFRGQLVQSGYHHVETVYEHGEVAIRGAVIDLFPMGSDHPIRVDLFDDEIEVLKYFDPETQRSLEKLESIALLPAKEFPLNDESITTFRTRYRDAFDVVYKECTLYQDISDGLCPAGIEYFLPLFFEQTSTLFDYLPDNTLIINFDDLSPVHDKFWQDVSERYESRRHDVRHPILAPHELFLPSEQFFAQLKRFPRVSLSNKILEGKTPAVQNIEVDINQNYFIDARANSPLNAIEAHLMETKQRILFCAESLGRRESIVELFKKQNIELEVVDDWQSFFSGKQSIALTVGPLQQGLNWPNQNLTIISEPQLFGDFVVRQRSGKKANREDNDLIVKNLTELNIGDAVVHLDHGVGRYLGLMNLEVDGQQQEFLHLEYANESKLYVPVGGLHLISRYSASDSSTAPLHRLGTEKWSVAKRKAAEKIRDTAAELLVVYAKREAKKGHAYPHSDEEYKRFARGFGFEETPDQEAAINAVMQDMYKAKPMDRLVCGDVGFGKTEVALRAAFIAAHSGKQVAILAPTTLLAQQHYENFLDRFADFADIKVGLLSRFANSKDVKATIHGLETGAVNIVIGTHKLLSKDVKFGDLGLMIIDEEHRFGVQQKEKMKALRANIDILTLTATPIPRTLNMSMSSMRDLSIIATPPAKRLSVKTFVRQTDDNLIKESVLREILRGGQVYYLHNAVDDIEKTAANIQKLVPEARVTIGHGQMPERQLERVMSDFYHKKFNVLVCTTIIETGIDVPSANTIIIDRADKFGLAQLHQLRGRVGRSHHQAYAYLLTPPPKSISKDAVKRLEAIEEAHDLGAGFTLATHDLEIRGAGELLGEEQSGHIQGIGFSLYLEMLDKAVKALREGKAFDFDSMNSAGADINLRLPAIIPTDYLPDINQRLSIYKRISTCDNDEDLRDLQVEMIDRFGLLPDPVKNLIRQTSLRWRLDKLGIKKWDMGDKGGSIEFDKQTEIDPFTLVQLIQAMPHKFKLNKAHQLKFFIESEGIEQRFERINDILKMISKKP